MIKPTSWGKHLTRFRLAWSDRPFTNLKGISIKASEADGLLLHLGPQEISDSEIDQALGGIQVSVFLTYIAPHFAFERKIRAACHKHNSLQILNGDLCRLTHDTVLMAADGWPIRNKGWIYDGLENWLGLVAPGCSHILLAANDVPRIDPSRPGTNLALGEALSRFCIEQPHVAVTILCPGEGTSRRIRRFKNLHIRFLEGDRPRVEVLDV